MAQIRHDSVNSTNRMESDLFNSDLCHFHMAAFTLQVLMTNSDFVTISDFLDDMRFICDSERDIASLVSDLRLCVLNAAPFENR